MKKPVFYFHSIPSESPHTFFSQRYPVYPWAQEQPVARHIPPFWQLVDVHGGTDAGSGAEIKNIKDKKGWLETSNLVGLFIFNSDHIKWHTFMCSYYIYHRRLGWYLKGRTPPPRWPQILTGIFKIWADSMPLIPNRGSLTVVRS